MTIPEVGHVSAARRARVWRIAGVTAGVVLVAGVVVGPGFDQREVSPQDPSVWVVQGSGSGAQYARVNTTLGELDTVKKAFEASDVVQYGSDLLVYSSSLTAVSPVAPGRAADILEGEGEPTPGGTTDIVHAGDFVAYLTTDGAVWGGRVSDGTALTPVPLDPYADAERGEGGQAPEFAADAVAVDTDGRVLAYSSRASAVMRGSIAAPDETPEVSDAPAGLDATDVELTWVGDSYAVLDPQEGELFIEGRPGGIGLDTDDAALQRGGVDAAVVTVADRAGLLQIDMETGRVQRTFGAAGIELGTPARPDRAGQALAAAWLPAGAGPGTLWTSAAGGTQLSYGAQTLPDDLAPVLRSNGAHTVLNDARSGWVWSVPSGALVASSQQWTPEDATQTQAADQEVTPEVTEPRAPVAVDDSFGVRAGRQVRVPVLLNDHDANEDALAVVLESVDGLSADFGTVSVAQDGQALTVAVSPDATGTATLNYAISDGALASALATVTLTVSAADQNAPPVWCGVDACLEEAPTLAVPAGSSGRVDVLTGWVDPDGDPVYVAAATTEAAASRAVAAADGTVLFTHEDSHGEGGQATVDYVVSDVHGATTDASLVASVEAAPRMEVETLTVQVAAGAPQSIDVADHISGASGPLVVSEPTAEGAVVAPATDVLGFTFVAQEQGTYEVEYVVSDGLTEARGVARVDVIDPADAHIATVPLTAFVRAGEDVTLDVVGSATNPAGWVLMVDDAQADTAVGGGLGERGTLQASVVGLSALRLSGTTADSQPGPLGTVTYTLTDGAGHTATGEVAVVMVDSTVAPPPAAVDDAYTVRAGTQVDFRVLRNDAGAPGTVVALAAGSVQARDGEGLAFTAGRLVRYLAPTVPGTYEFTYDAYAVGYPSQTSRATVRVTVVGEDGNVPPTPADVVARVNAGLSVTIPIEPGGQDPDGDRIALVGITTAPHVGTATVSPDGAGVVFTAPAQVGEGTAAASTSFEYAVSDGRGGTATATARVAMAGSSVAPAPLTFTDYVQVQVGEGNKVVIEPTANDTDPEGGELTLESIVPDAQESTREYEELSARLSVDGEVVTIDAGDTPSTYAFLYSARNERGSVAVGRVVVKVVREPIPDLPIIADTALPFKDREQFLTGVDVLADKVTWATGDPGALAVGVYPGQEDVRSAGATLSGPLPDASRLVVFSVEGADFAGEPTTTYGFLTVPGIDDFVPRLDADLEPVEVPERESQSFDIASMISIPDGATLDVDAGAVKASGARSEGRCTHVGGTQLQYAAGTGAPYVDACVVAVKLAAQDDFTVVSIPVVVVPVDPIPELHGLSLEVSPGDTKTVDLTDAVTWPGGIVGREVTLVPSAVTGSSFTVTAAGDTLTIHGDAAAMPGASETISISVTSHEGVVPATLLLTVGPAPSTLPKGAAIVEQCSASAGSSCDITVIGGPGEVNPLPARPLTLIDVMPADDCDGVTFSRRDDSTVRFSWTAGAPGGVCDAVFTVQDSQRRVSSGDRNGSVSIDFQGLPAAPASVEQVAYGDGSITFAVNPGAAASSYPAIDGFRVKRGSTVVATCAANGACEPATGMTNGDSQSFTAVAFNRVGESPATGAVQAWAYAPPAAIPAENISVTPEPNPPVGGRISVEATVSDPSTSHVLFTVGGVSHTAQVERGRARARLDGVPNTSTPMTVTPASRFELPPGAGSSGIGSTTVAVNGIGAPTLTVSQVDSGADDGSATFTVTVGSGGDGSTTRVAYDVRRNHGGAPRCDAGSGEERTGTFTIDVPVEENSDYAAVFCAESRVGWTSFGSVTAPTLEWDLVTAARPVLSGASWGVHCDGTTCRTVEGGSGAGGQTPTASGSTPSRNALVWFANANAVGTSFPWSHARDGATITARYCREGRTPSDRNCGEPSAPVVFDALNGGSPSPFAIAPFCAVREESPEEVDETTGEVTSPATYLIEAGEGRSGTPPVTVHWTWTPAFESDPTTTPFVLPAEQITASVGVTFTGAMIATAPATLTIACTGP